MPPLGQAKGMSSSLLCYIFVSYCDTTSRRDGAAKTDTSSSLVGSILAFR